MWLSPTTDSECWWYLAGDPCGIAETLRGGPAPGVWGEGERK